jgi:hypothetical protein
MMAKYFEHDTGQATGQAETKFILSKLPLPRAGPPDYAPDKMNDLLPI